MSSSDIRAAFLSYFEQNGHKVRPSSPLVLPEDDSLMFVNSGMVQFKNNFTGAASPLDKNVTTCQKCVRAGGKHNDLDNVGYTARHHTFFEMLGNFSFSGYFKERAISLAWGFLVDKLSIDKNKLYVTVYHDDEEAIDIWRKTANLPDDRIIRINSSDNFWQMGDVGPCGPCSEIFYDHGPHVAGGLPGTPEQDGDRFKEIWNLVFMQYELMPDGNMIKLPKPAIDTGAGLERIAAVMQGTHHNYETDIFKSIIDTSINIAGGEDNITAHRVIADHIRSSAFLIADGVMPANDGRGYVLRRIMRRAMRYIINLGYKDLLMHKLIQPVIDKMGEAYPELIRARPTIEETLKFEESRFRDTLESGLKILNKHIVGQNHGFILGGDVAFMLYDTYGLPLDLTKDVLRSQGIGIDEKGFEHSMEEQKKRAKASWVGTFDKSTQALWSKILEQYGPTTFTGYKGCSTEDANILAIIKDNNIIQSAEAGDEVIIVCNQTPFYGESGGQCGDTGFLNEHNVLDTKKYLASIIGHYVRLTSSIATGDKCKLQVDYARRKKIMAHHSATHMLHHALRAVLGEHVTQKGSYVGPDYLRFDFSHMSALKKEQIDEVERLINEEILQNHLVSDIEMSMTEAMKLGVMALFGEKYNDEVRVITIDKSRELCGGTHVNRTGDIGMFKIISEEALASGIRRIEAVAGMAAFNAMNPPYNAYRSLALTLNCPMVEVTTKIKSLIEERKKLEKQFGELKTSSFLNTLPEPSKNGVLLAHINDVETEVLRNIASKAVQKSGIKLVVLYSRGELGLSVVACCNKTSDGLFSAIDILNRVMESFGGKGGGNTTLGQIGRVQCTPQELTTLLESICH